LLRYNNVKLALIEAKKAALHPTEGLQQVIDYGKKLDLDFVYSTNGKEIYEFQLSKGKGRYIDEFPTPQELYDKIYNENKELKEHLLKILFFLKNLKPGYNKQAELTIILNIMVNEIKGIFLPLLMETGKILMALQM